MTYSLLEIIYPLIHELLASKLHEWTIRTLVIDFIDELLIEDVC